jgi:hypothetical protein
MKNLIIIITTIICTTILFGCNKTKTAVLPPATTTGANTFGCKVNGVVCATSGYKINSILSDGIGVVFNGWSGLPDAIMEFSATTENPKYYFKFSFNCEGKTGTFYSKGGALYTSTIIDLTNTNGGSAVLGSNQYDTDSTNFATIHVTKYDADNKGIAGTFEMNAINDKGTITRITEGRFDLRRP